MELSSRIERALTAAMLPTEASPCPPQLANALHAAVFPAGHRFRPRLALSVALACGDPDPAATDAVAVAIELLHCGSLVHDDLPCFDNADLRRGLPTIHVTFGEPIAVLVGDTLIVSAFEALAFGAAASPQKLAALVRLVAQAAGAPHGICAGQAWESETSIPLVAYHQAKTGSLFAAAASGGAIAAGHSQPDAWGKLGGKIGQAYQIADDIRDAAATVSEAGKPIGQDEAHGRPSAAREWGLRGAVRALSDLLDETVAMVPECQGQARLQAAIRHEMKRFLPEGLVAQYA
jgi:geranylgeranyl diphosphate synthase, type II